MANKISKVVLCIIFVVLVGLFIKGYLYKNEIDENREQAICKFVHCRTAPKTSASYFKYFINNKSYRNSYGQCPDEYEKKINKFFTLSYSSKDPNKIEVDFSNQITDTTAILEAGFTKEEIGNGGW